MVKKDMDAPAPILPCQPTRGAPSVDQERYIPEAQAEATILAVAKTGRLVMVDIMLGLDRVWFETRFVLCLVIEWVPGISQCAMVLTNCEINSEIIDDVHSSEATQNICN